MLNFYVTNYLPVLYHKTKAIEETQLSGCAKNIRYLYLMMWGEY